jgi:predicted O-linked N-acetylglucosamine transferase (SPINDLY family)
LRLEPGNEGLRADVINLYVDSDRPEMALAVTAEMPGGLQAINSPELLAGIGRALKLRKRYEEALDLFDRAVRLAPDNARILAERADCFELGGLYEEALADWSAVSHLRDAAFREAGVRAAALEAELGQPDRAWRRLIERSSGLDRSAQEKYFKSALFTINYANEADEAEIFALYREFERRFMQVARLPSRSPSTPEGSQKVRIGYVSGDFRKHSATFFALPLLENHDRDRFEVFAYSTLQVKYEDEWTGRFRGCVDHFVRVAQNDDDTLAMQIANDGIDVLVDLSGHTVGGRLGVFARRPAPVSVTWLGYGYTTGLSTIDWFLADELLVPKGSEQYFSERPWYLNRPYLVYRPDEAAMGECGPLPALERGHVVFGTLSRTIRINDRLLSVWGEILRRVPGSKLHIDNKHVRHPSARKLFLERCLAQGIAEDRLILEYHSPPWDVVRSFDLTLDCFPHNSGTTLFESAFMGVPFVTLADRPSVGRIGSSVAHGLGHPEWVAQTEAEYVEKAVAMVSDLEQLAALRAGLRERMKASPLMDEAGFARSVEQAYLGMCEASRVKAET